MIPKIIHQIWVGPYKIPMRESELVKNIKKHNFDYEHMFWNQVPTDMPTELKNWYDTFYEKKDYAFCADLIRQWVVFKFGGFYFDVDWEVNKRLDDFLPYDHVFFHHHPKDFTIPNQIFAAKKESEILGCCIKSAEKNKGWFGPSWFGESVKECLGFKYEVSHEEVKRKLRTMNSEFYYYAKFEEEYGRHKSLYSWSKENKKRFLENEQL